MFSPINSRRNRRRLGIFASCLGFSLLVWLIFSLSNLYTYKIERPILFTGFSQSRPINLEYPENFELSITGTGWKLISLRMGLQVDSLELNTHDINYGKNYFLLSAHMEQLGKNLPEGIQLVGVYPDTVFYNYDIYSRKKVPVFLDTNISFKKQFFYGPDIRISPDSVWITGTPQNIEQIDSICTEPLNYRDISQDIHTSVLIKEPASTIKIEPKQVDVSIPVEQFAENTITLPLKITGNKLDLEVNTYPAQVKVTYLVPMSRFDELKPDFFEVSVNINQWMRDKVSILPVSMTRVPEYVRITNINPAKVDFLVKK